MGQILAASMALLLANAVNVPLGSVMLCVVNKVNELQLASAEAAESV